MIDIIVIGRTIINTKTNDIRFSPLYDNGSSLCCYVREDKIDNLLRDGMAFKAQVNTKSKSVIGWNKKRPIKHFELLEYLKNEYYGEIKLFLESINDNINKNNLVRILDNFEEEIISRNRKELILKFLLKRRNRIIDNL